MSSTTKLKNLVVKMHVPFTLVKKISCVRIWALARFEYLKVISETSVCN